MSELISEQESKKIHGSSKEFLAWRGKIEWQFIRMIYQNGWHNHFFQVKATNAEILKTFREAMKLVPPNLRFTCHTCEKLVKRMGGVIALHNNQVLTIWDLKSHTPYDKISEAMRNFVISREIEDIFVFSKENAPNFIRQNTYVDSMTGEIIRGYNHLFVNVSTAYRNLYDTGLISDETYYGQGFPSVRDFKDNKFQVSDEWTVRWKKSIYRGAYAKLYNLMKKTTSFAWRYVYSAMRYYAIYYPDWKDWDWLHAIGDFWKVKQQFNLAATEVEVNYTLWENVELIWDNQSFFQSKLFKLVEKISQIAPEGVTIHEGTEEYAKLQEVLKWYRRSSARDSLRLLRDLHDEMEMTLCESRTIVV